MTSWKVAGNIQFSFLGDNSEVMICLPVNITTGTAVTNEMYSLNLTSESRGKLHRENEWKTDVMSIDANVIIINARRNA